MWTRSLKRPDEIFPALTADYERVFGPHLISVILYGSAAGGAYLQGNSDLNFLVVLTDQGIGRLDLASELVRRWGKRRAAIPLFMTPAYLRGACDACPIELLNMKRRYVLVTGEDVLADLAFDPGHVRLQLEREFRGKLIELRTGYLAAGGSARKLRRLIAGSVTTFVSLFAALLYLKKAEIPEGRSAVIDAAGRAAGVDAPVFRYCEAVRRKTDRFSRDQIRALFQDYLKEAACLCDQAADWKTGAPKARVAALAREPDSQSRQPVLPGL
ncbi:MAG: hypothetical protein FWE89_04225 [Syntrophaceae bacterium]|nr:hypothetical protein [Syntrophaceae bacterium]